MLLGPDPPVNFPWYGTEERTRVEWEAFKDVVKYLDVPVHGSFLQVKARALNAARLAQAWNEWDEKRWFSRERFS